MPAGGQHSFDEAVAINSHGYTVFAHNLGLFVTKYGHAKSCQDDTDDG
jgi:hypothetical protein